VIVAERFAEEHDLEVGDRLLVIMNNKKEALRVVARALSPEFVYLIRGGGELLPDAKHFTVLWVSRTFAEAVFDSKDACNDVVATLSREARLEDAIDAFDRRLDRYGAIGAYGRRDQLSARSLDDEIEGLRGSATMTPTIFLGVAAFVLNMLMRRLVQTQRTQIALVRAMGYGVGAVVAHYLKLALLVGFLGAVLGIGFGLWFAHGMAGVYQKFFSFPVLYFRTDPRVIAGGFLVSLLFAAAGALGAVLSVARLDPAQGLRPESPRLYRRTLFELFPLLWRQLGFTTRMILRNVARTKLRTAVTITGVALAASILLLAFFSLDSLDVLMDHQFRLVQRQDIRVTFHEERSRAALYELRRLEGVRTVQGEFGLAVRFRNGWRSKRTGISGLERDRGLYGLLDRDVRPVSVPPDGLLLSDKLARILGVGPGDEVDVEVLTGRKQRLRLPVAQVVEEYLGTFAYADLTRLSRWVNEELTLTGALLKVDPRRAAELGRKLKELPAVAAVEVKKRTLESFQETIATSQGIMTTTLIIFAGVITFGVIYNAARISLSERQRELGSMRVLGFTHGEVATVLMGENLLLTGVALAPGIALGLFFSWLLTIVYDTDLYRFPFVVQPKSILITVVTVLAFALLANLAVRRRLGKLDLVEVLKERE
jgi:putative ABC transport system permease protein